MKGRVCLVTGATSGHGRAVAAGLARLGAEVIVHGRSPERCREVQEEIAPIAGRRPEAIVCDLASAADIDRAASDLLSTGRPLHVLVNNAGAVNRTRTVTRDGIETTLAVNYLAHFQLTMRLLGRMRESAPSRIVNVCSDMHRTVALDLDDLELRSGYGFMRAYGISKLALVHFTVELARRLEGTGVTVNALDPGPVDSNIGQNNPGLARHLLRVVMRIFFPSPERAARTAIHLASAPDLESVTGRYFKRMAQRSPSLSPDPLAGRRLWKESVRMTGTDMQPGLPLVY